MASMATAVITGRLTRDAELKYVSSGEAILRFSLATDARIKKGGEWVEEPSFWEIDLWGKRAESINQYLTKGKLVTVYGSMRQDKWEKDGQTKMKIVVNANDVQILSPKDSQGEARHDQSQARPAQRPAEARTAPPRQQASVPDDGFSDDIPF